MEPKEDLPVVTDDKFSRARLIYGLTSEIHADRRSPGDTGDTGEMIVVGGVDSHCVRWTQVLSRRAAQQLWIQLTRLLFPEKYSQVVGLVPLEPWCPPRPRVTTRFEVLWSADAHVYEILGWVDDGTWWFRVDEQNAHRLWVALDLALYPAGWSGPVIVRRKKLN